MAHKEPGDLVSDRPRVQHPYNSFGDRYPDYMSWLDGSIWVLDVETDIKEPLGSFTASMRYQARIYKQKLITHLRWREIDGENRRVLLIQAVPRGAA